MSIPGVQLHQAVLTLINITFRDSVFDRGIKITFLSLSIGSLFFTGAGAGAATAVPPCYLP